MNPHLHAPLDPVPTLFRQTERGPTVFDVITDRTLLRSKTEEYLAQFGVTLRPQPIWPSVAAWADKDPARRSTPVRCAERYLKLLHAAVRTARKAEVKAVKARKGK